MTFQTREHGDDITTCATVFARPNPKLYHDSLSLSLSQSIRRSTNSRPKWNNNKANRKQNLIGKWITTLPRHRGLASQQASRSESTEKGAIYGKHVNGTCLWPLEPLIHQRISVRRADFDCAPRFWCTSSRNPFIFQVICAEGTPIFSSIFKQHSNFSIRHKYLITMKMNQLVSSAPLRDRLVHGYRQGTSKRTRRLLAALLDRTATREEVLSVVAERNL
jgi:hypothetical protein